MPKEIEEFAKALVESVRDPAIQSCDLSLSDTARTLASKRWRQLKGEQSSDDLSRMIIADCVDQVLFYLLRSIDERTLELLFSARNGDVVNLSEAGKGELAGYFIGSGGWRSKYSKERFYDDFADMKLDL